MISKYYYILLVMIYLKRKISNVTLQGFYHDTFESPVPFPWNSICLRIRVTTLIHIIPSILRNISLYGSKEFSGYTKYYSRHPLLLFKTDLDTSFFTNISIYIIIIIIIFYNQFINVSVCVLNIRLLAMYNLSLSLSGLSTRAWVPSLIIIHVIHVLP